MKNGYVKFAVIGAVIGFVVWALASVFSGITTIETQDFLAGYLDMEAISLAFAAPIVSMILGSLANMGSYFIRVKLARVKKWLLPLYFVGVSAISATAVLDFGAGGPIQGELYLRELSIIVFYAIYVLGPVIILLGYRNFYRLNSNSIVTRTQSVAQHS